MSYWSLLFFVGVKSSGVVGGCCFWLALSLLELLAVVVFCWRYVFWSCWLLLFFVGVKSSGVVGCCCFLLALSLLELLTVAVFLYPCNFRWNLLQGVERARRGRERLIKTITTPGLTDQSQHKFKLSEPPK